jgi:hypothetical protein
MKSPTPGSGDRSRPLALLAVIARSPCDEAIQGPRTVAPGLLRCARNDGGLDPAIIGCRLNCFRWFLIRPLLHPHTLGREIVFLVQDGPDIPPRDDFAVAIEVASGGAAPIYPEQRRRPVAADRHRRGAPRREAAAVIRTVGPFGQREHSFLAFHTCAQFLFVGRL